MLQRIKNIHPAWFIGGFFALLIGFNIAFFTLAAVKGVQLMPPGGTQAEAQVLAAEYAAERAAERTGRTVEAGPTTGTVERVTP